MTRRIPSLPEAIAAALVLATAATPIASQSYRARLDASSQSVSFRGLVADSIPAAQTVPAVSGGQQTPDGHAVRCGGGAYCFYFRPGEVLRALPMAASGSVTLWGLGVEGLSLRATGRLVTDLGSQSVWPGTTPAAQLIEGYVEYRRSVAIARAGRQMISSRLEAIGFDGAWMRARWDAASLEFTGYGGFGLGHAAAHPVASPALNPLDEWRPRDRQLVAGVEGAWAYREMDVRAEYRREVDPQDDYFVSERTALSLGARILDFRASGGMDYNIAEGRLGSADLRLTYLQPRYSLSAGTRRYVPYFSLWTLWGAFSPVPHDAVSLSGQVQAAEGLTLNWRGERYRYHDADISTALVPRLEDRGWRMSAGITASPAARWLLRGTLGMEYGPGAAGRFADAAITYAHDDLYAVDIYGGSLARPLELRYQDATSHWIGGRLERHLGAQRRVWGDVALFDDRRERPDASASSMSQIRLRAGLSVAFGSGADRLPLPPARRTGQ